MPGCCVASRVSSPTVRPSATSACGFAASAACRFASVGDEGDSMGHDHDHDHDHDHPHDHDHDHEHPHDHDHEHWDHPGRFADRDPPLDRDFTRRAFTVGIGGPVGSGKTALVLALCRALRDSLRLGVVTNDIFTREDAEFLTRHAALPPEQIRAVETGGCPHAAIRADI